MADDSFEEYCVAACRVPVEFGKDKLIKILEGLSGARVTKVVVVDGAENDPNLEKVLLKLDSRKGATKLHEDVGHTEIEVDGNSYEIVFDKCLGCEIPTDWNEDIDDMDDIEIDGDPDAESTPKPQPRAQIMDGGEGATNTPQSTTIPDRTFYQNVPNTPADQLAGSNANMNPPQPQQGQNVHPGQPQMFNPQMYFQAHGFNPRMVPAFMHPGFPPNAGQMPRHQGQGQGTNPNTGQRFALPPNYQGMPGFPPNMGMQYPFPMPGQMPQQGKGDNQQQNFADSRTGKVSPPPPYTSGGQQEPMETDNTTHVKEKLRDTGDSQAVHDQDEQLRKLKEKEKQAGQNYDNPESGNFDEKGSTNKIVIKDLPPEADEEYIKLVFEKKQFGSHDVERIEIDRELNMALLVFDDTEAVDRIMKHPAPIKLKNSQVRVQAYFEIKEEPLPLCTIEVTGLDGFDVETIEMYFENRRSGGDAIEELKYNENEGRAFITYKTEEVARRVVDRGNHVLNRQPLEVTLYQPLPKHRWNVRTPSPEPEPLPLDTVRIVGLGDTIDKDILEMYFENERKSGGDDIKNIQMFGDVAYITYHTEEVAQRVVDNGPHTLSRCKLEVSLGRPEDEDRRTYSRETSVEPQCTIQVSGFDETTDKDMLEMYFENTKRNGGGDIADIQLDEENCVAYITFCEEEVAQRVVNREHTLNKKPLQVTLYRPNRSPSPEPEPEPITVIEVHGVGLSLDEETIEMYFENEKRSGGSEIQDVRVDRDTGIAYVDYGSEEVAKRVVEKGGHQLNKRELRVTLHIQVNTNTKQKRRVSLTTQKSLDAENTADDKPTETSVVKVKGVKRMPSLDTVKFYFENSRRSDGGDIKDVTHHDDDDDIVFITFEDPEAAKRVAGRQHSVDNQMLEVSLHVPKPRPFYEDKILIKGLKETVTQDGLFNFLEAKSGSIPTELWRGEIEGVVIVVFKNEPNFQKLEEVCKKVPLEGGYLGVQRIQMTNCIIVINVPDDTTKDTIQFYFENGRRSNGGEIDKVVMRDEDRSCLVYFVDYRVVDRVLEKTHKLSEVTLIVKLYIDGFGCPGGEQIEATLKLPDVISITDIDSKKIKFIKNSKPTCEAIEMQMSGVNAEIIWPEKAGKEKDGLKQSILIKCTITKDTKNAKKLVKTWRKDAGENFNDFVKNILVEALYVSQELWNVAMDKIRNFQIKYPERVAILVDKDQHNFSVVGLIPAVEEVSKDLRGMIKEIEDEAAKEKERTKETITSLKLIETKMLLAEKFPSKIEQKFQGLKVKINQNKNEIVFDGSFGDINAAKMLMYETKEDFASVSVDMKGSRSMFLLYENKPVKDYIVKKLKNNQVAAVWEVKDQKIVVCSTKEDTLDKSVEIVTKAVVESSVGLSRENSEAIQTPAWRSVEEELAQRFPGKVGFEIQSSCIYVCSTDDISREVLGVVKRYLKSNTIIEEHVDFSRNINKLIEKDHKDEIATISKKYASLNAQITPKADNSGFIIRGTEEGLQAMKRELESLKMRVHVQDHTLQSPGIEDHMKGKGRDHFTAVENKVPVVFSAADDSEPEYDELDNVSGPRVHAECRAYDDRKIYTAEGDMTELRVDVLVNTADSKLSLTGGLGKAIVAKGGNEVLNACKDYIRDEGELGEGEAFISPAGRLRASYIVHIVGPVWRGGTNNEETILAESVLKAMKQATVKNVKSVALPAISCGVYGFPVKRATKIIVQGVKNFFREVQESTIMEVYLCDVKTNTIEGFTEALNAEFGDRYIRILPQTKQAARPKLPAPRGSYSMMTSPGTDDDDSGFSGARYKTMQDFRQGGGIQVGKITVTVKKGEIARESVDVIVNTTARNLDLKNGAVSMSLLRAAGNQLQAEVSKQYPNGIKDGEIAVTSGQALKCKIIIHTSLVNWDGKNNEAKKALHTLMNNCLNEADTKGHTSIAFPAIGTGNLGFPRDVVAKEMFTVISNYSRDNPSSNITDVRFIVYQKDTGTINAFDAEEKVWRSRDGGANKTRQARQYDHHTYANLKELRQSDSEDEDSDGSGSYATVQDDDVKRLSVTVTQGDITKVTCDAIVNSSNDSLDLSKGAVSQALMKIGGQELDKECKAKAKTMKKDNIVVTGAPGFPFNNIIHVVAQDSTKAWKKMIDKCFQVAENSKIKSLAFPALGTNIQANPSDIADAMVSSLREFEAKPHQYLQEVKFIIFQGKMVQTFQKAIEETKKSKGIFSTMLSGLKGLASGGSTKQDKSTKQKAGKGKTGSSDTYNIRVYSMSMEHINKAIQELEKLIKNEVTSNEFEDKAFGTLQTSQRKGLKGLEKEYGVQIKFVTNTKIQVIGMIKNVMEVSNRINGIIRELDRMEHQKKEASRVSKMVQWFFIEITDIKQELVNYEPSVNMLIESAFSEGQPTVTFCDSEGQKYVIDFANMHEYPEGDPNDTVNVIRRDLLKGGSVEIPKTWTQMSDENLRVITLQTSSQEFKDISSNFQTSVGNSNFSVTKIDRIQNKTLWMQYQAKKQQLDSMNKGGQNERMLWHGTTMDSVDSINANGFNRSYCGKNATAFGDGVYFAVNASYSCSDTYARPDGSGIKRMYCCCVLTREYTMGKSGMRVPPSKDGGATGSLYDSVVNNVGSPTMFIIFHDTQAYPQYLIHFKKN